MVTTFDYPEQKEEMELFVAANQPCHVWHDKTVIRVYTGADIPKLEVTE